MKVKRKDATISLFIIVLVIMFLLRVKHINNTKEAIFENFSLSFKGVLLSKRDLGHDAAKCVIKVITSNKPKYEGEIWGGVCILESDTVKMDLIYSHCLREGYFVEVGPGSHLVIKDFNKKILFDYNGGVDICN